MEIKLVKPLSFIGVIGGQGGGCGRALDQVGGDRRVASLTGRDDEGDEASQPVDRGVELGGRAAARSAYGVGRSSPFPPVAERCALAQVESSISSPGGSPDAANSSNARVQTSALAQRTPRL